MKGSHTRGLQLRNVRMTLSKLDAKYSKSSVLANEEDSDFDDDLLKHTHSPPSLEHVPEVESGIALSNFPDQHNLPLLKSSESSEKMKFTLKPVSPCEQESSQGDSTSLDTANSIESVKTESTLGFINIHSVSSLADSRSHGKERRMSISPLIPVQKLQAIKSSSASKVDYESIISNNIKNEISEDTSCSASSKSIQKLMTQKSEDAIESIRREVASLTEEEPGFQRITPTDMHEPAQKRKNSWRTSEKRKEKGFHHCNCNKPLKFKRKSIAVQTHSLGHQEVESCVIKNNLIKNDSGTECYFNTPAITASKLPHYLNDLATSNRAPDLENVIRSQASGSFVNELSELISHHLHLTKEFLERQHRMYLANCKAVQLLEKGYQDNMLQGP